MCMYIFLYTLTHVYAYSSQVEGITCAACVGRIERGLGRIDGVLSVSVSLATNRAKVCFDAGQTGVRSILKK
jgi:Cu+-exporting ATPase